MLEQLRNQLRALLDQRAERQASLDALLEAPVNEERTLSDEERSRFDELRGELTDLDAQRAQIEADIAELEQLAEARANAEAVTIPAVDTDGESRGVEIRVGNEPELYRAGGEHDFIEDVFAQHAGDARAAERIARHNDIARRGLEQRATTSAWTGVVIPRYLLDMFAPKLRSGRPFLSAVRNLSLPANGMTVTIPKTLSGSTVAAQSDQNTAVDNTTMATTNLVVNVNTYAGQQVASRQAVQRGQGTSEIIVADLFAEYATKTNIGALAGSGTNGTHLGVLGSTLLTTQNVTETSAVAILRKIAGATVGIQTGLYDSPDLIVMHPRRWAHIVTATDSSGRPLAGVEAGQQNVWASGQLASTGGPVGSIHGIPVITDAGIPTNLNGTWNTDAVIVTRREEILFWEEQGGPQSVTLEEVLANQLSVRFVLHGYSAFTAERRTEATQVLTGTGLIPPTF